MVNKYQFGFIFHNGIISYNEIIFFTMKLHVFLNSSIGELVQHGKNGFLFETYLELSQQILTWFYDYPHNATLVNVKEEFNERLQEYQNRRWDDNWNQHALPAFLD